jgi:hypothetical protein
LIKYKKVPLIAYTIPGEMLSSILRKLPPGQQFLHCIIYLISYGKTSTKHKGSGMFIPEPGPEFFYPGSRVKKIPNSGSRIRIRIKEFKVFLFLTQKIVSKLSEI